TGVAVGSGGSDGSDGSDDCAESDGAALSEAGGSLLPLADSAGWGTGSRGSGVSLEEPPHPVTIKKNPKLSAEPPNHCVHVIVVELAGSAPTDPVPTQPILERSRRVGSAQAG
ncbi:MAG TPA: hypothetical protein VN764_18005, partial [Polyangiaceae bacterium]|nr:hypothetical protein [Polyangiaceae bacterium]